MPSYACSPITPDPQPGPQQPTRHPDSPDAIAERQWFTALLRTHYRQAKRRGDNTTAAELANIAERIKNG